MLYRQALFTLSKPFFLEVLKGQRALDIPEDAQILSVHVGSHWIELTFSLYPARRSVKNGLIKEQA